MVILPLHNFPIDQENTSLRDVEGYTGKRLALAALVTISAYESNLEFQEFQQPHCRGTTPSLSRISSSVIEA
jgi:hypothetical protein